MTTKISYLRDPKAPQRVLTLVSRVNGDKVEYGFSMNRPTRWRRKQDDRSSRYEDLIKGDQFSKTRGRQIAAGRLVVEPLVADLAGREPDVAIFETLRDASDNSLIRRIAGHYLATLVLTSAYVHLRTPYTSMYTNYTSMSTS